MSETKLFTIGHSNRTSEEFLALLDENHITAVADVRSAPYSRQFPQFNSELLKASLENKHIDYVFMGNELGARRSERECYVDDVAAYELIAKTRAFQSGLDRIRRGVAKRTIALMCSEKDPLTCHRTILICRYLKDEFQIWHIIDPDEIESQLAAEHRLLELVKLPSKCLIQSEDELIEDAYEKQGKRIAYRELVVDSTTSTQGE